jgi:glutaredoxin-like protein NrdH
VKSYLTRSEIPFEIRDITTDPAAHARVVELGYTGTPVIEHPEGHFKGYDPEKLESIKVALFAMA